MTLVLKSEDQVKETMAKSILQILDSMDRQLSCLSEDVGNLKDSLFTLGVETEVLKYKYNKVEKLIEGKEVYST